MPNLLNANESMFTAFEPMQQNRFIMYVDGIPSYTIKSVSMPSIQQGKVKLDHINVYHLVKGKSEWQDINMTLYNPISPSGSQAVMEWVRLSHESVTGRDGYSDMYKKRVVINILGPVNDIVGEWVLEGAWVKSANFNKFDWSTEGPANIDVTLSYDYAVLNY